MFIKENVNPEKKKTGDCVIRAIAKAEGKPWLVVFDSLVDIARKTYSSPSYKDVYGMYLGRYKKVTATYAENGKKKYYTVGQVAKWDGTYIINVRKHLTTVIDGNIYDIWDTTHKKALNIWKAR